jgi:SNF2 family DNA or RNA helicase
MLTRYGVIADRVGAGKSLVTLSLVRDPPVEQSQLSIREGGVARIIGLRHMPDIQHWPEGLSAEETREALCRAPRFYSTTSLIVVPHNVAQQWETYIKEQTTLTALFVRKTKDCDPERDGFLRSVLTADVVLLSCTMLRRFDTALHSVLPGGFGRVVWSRLFIDEADTIQCGIRPGEVNARFTWFITGSWLNMLFPCGLYWHTIQSLSTDIQHTIGDGVIAGLTNSRSSIVANTVSDSRDARFAALILRNTDAWVEASLSRPAIVHETVVCKAPANLGILRDFVSPAAMEALHAGDTAGALTALGLKAASQESLTDRVTASLRGELVQAEKTLAYKRDYDYASASAKTHAIEKAEANVTRLREQVAALEARVASATNELCPICYDTPRTATLTPCCRAAFCLACICHCIHTKPVCPMCRAAITSPRNLLVIGEGDVSGSEVPATTILEPPTKGAALLKLLAESTADQRFLVFSAHEASFRGLREMLAARGIRCEMLFGTAARVERLRKQFRDGTVRVLCMNARHVGAGINLEAATHVVLYHRMNVELERQVIGRAVRFERAAELRVVHLVHESETALNGDTGSEVIVHL